MLLFVRTTNWFDGGNTEMLPLYDGMDKSDTESWINFIVPQAIWFIVVKC